MIQIKTTEAKLKSVNLSNEGSEENPTSRTDLSFECLAAGSMIGVLAGVENTKAFWDENGNILQLGVASIDSQAEIEDCEMSFAGLTIKHCKAKKFSFKPLNERQLKLTCMVQVHHTPDELTQIDKLQKKVDVLTLTTNQQDLFE